jgi:hypothetical protein
MFMPELSRITRLKGITNNNPDTENNAGREYLDNGAEK